MQQLACLGLNPALALSRRITLGKLLTLLCLSYIIYKELNNSVHHTELL